MSAWNGRDSPGLLKMEAGICLVQKLSKKESFCIVVQKLDFSDNLCYNFFQRRCAP